MFSKIVLIAVSALAAVTSVGSTPLSVKRNDELAPRTSQSFNNWGGFASLNNFDNFFGVDNFDGSRCSQTIITTQQSLVCHTQAIEIIQQRLLVIQEMARRIITETICEVETQTIVFEQFHSSLGNFGLDLRRLSGRQVGFDQNIFSHFGSIFNSDGSLTTNDFGFTGRDHGKNIVVVGGSNWNDATSFIPVNSAFNAARDAVVAIH